jgi:hypothetical protein
MEQEQVFAGTKTTLYHFDNAFQAVLLREVRQPWTEKSSPAKSFM